MKITNLILFLAITLLPLSAASQQIKRVNATVPTCPPHEAMIPVYEYESVDLQPQFPGGERGLINFINKTREYPYRAYEKKIEGRVICSFIINPDGSICEVQVIKGVEESLNREAVRIIKSMPHWKAGEIGSEAVHVHCILPISFRL